MRKNKMGSLFLVSVLALAGIGISYAGWTDTITVTGTVETGDVDIDVYAYSGTWIWKKIDDHTLIKSHQFITYPATDYDNDPDTVDDPVNYAWYSDNNYIMVASSWAEPGSVDYQTDPDHDLIGIVFNNLFPCQDFAIDFILHYDGSIPARLTGPILIGTDDGTGSPLPLFKTSNYNWLEYLWYEESINGYQDGGIGYEAYYSDATGQAIDPATGGQVTTPIPIIDGSQFEECNYIYVKLIIHIPQDNDYMNLFGRFTTEFEVIQWNEWGTNGECGEEPLIGHNADVMLCIDTSGSIGSDGVTVQNAAKAFVTALLAPDNGQVGIVNFDDGAWLLSTFDDDIPTLHGIIDGLSFTGPATDLGAGISLSQNELATMDRTPDAHADPTQAYPDYMVIITDGEPNTGGDGTAEATAAKNAGTRIFVLGIDTTGSTLLASIASSGDYYDVVDFSQLETILLGLVT